MTAYNEGTLAVTAAGTANVATDSLGADEGTLSISASSAVVIVTETPGGTGAVTASGAAAVVNEKLVHNEGTLAVTAAGSASIVSELFAHAAAAEYRLYRGVDGPIDYSSPWQTFASLPYEAPALAADHVYRFALRYVNKYGYESENLHEQKVFVNAAGREYVGEPDPPHHWTVTPAANGAVRVEANYYYELDRLAERADQWAVYLRSDGTDPDPDTDAPTLIDMVKVDGVAKLDWTSAEYAADTDVRVLVRTRRTTADGTYESPNEDPGGKPTQDTFGAEIIAEIQS